MRVSSFVCSAAFALLVAAPASAVTADFSPLTPGALIPENTDVNLGDGVFATITAGKGKKDRRAAVLDTDSTAASTGAGNDPDLFSPFQDVDGNLPDTSFGNAVIVQEKGSSIPDDQAGGGFLEFVFATLVGITHVDLLDVEEGTTVELFDGTGGLLDTMTGGVNSSGLTGLNPPTGPVNQFKRFAFAVDGVKTLLVTFEGSGAVGEIEVFGTDGQTGTIPVPFGLPLLASAFGLAALIRHRRGTA